jgi:hypothetical protein
LRITSIMSWCKSVSLYSPIRIRQLGLSHQLHKVKTTELFTHYHHPLKTKPYFFFLSPLSLSLCRELQFHSSSLFFYLPGIPCIPAKSLLLMIDEVGARPKFCQRRRKSPTKHWAVEKFFFSAASVCVYESENERRERERERERKNREDE